MESRLKFLGHPIHPHAHSLSLGAAGHRVALRRDPPDYRCWKLGGDGLLAHRGWVLGGLAAGAIGWIEWLAIPSSARAKRIDLTHGVTNVLVLLLFLVSWIWRQFITAPDVPGAVAIWLAVAGVLLAGIGGWLGGELVNRLGVGVDPGANLDSPSTLTRKPASASATPTHGSQAQAKTDEDGERGGREDRAA